MKKNNIVRIQTLGEEIANALRDILYLSLEPKGEGRFL